MDGWRTDRKNVEPLTRPRAFLLGPPSDCHLSSSHFRQIIESCRNFEECWLVTTTDITQLSGQATGWFNWQIWIFSSRMMHHNKNITNESLKKASTLTTNAYNTWLFVAWRIHNKSTTTKIHLVHWKCVANTLWACKSPIIFCTCGLMNLFSPPTSLLFTPYLDGHKFHLVL